MRLIFTPQEFKEVRRFVTNTKNRDIIQGFNRVFQTDNSIPVKGVALPKTGDIVVEMTSEDGTALLRVLSNNAGTFGEMIKNEISLTSVPKWLNFVKSVGETIKKLFQD